MNDSDKLRTILANERTLLAYIRTALSAWIFGMAAIKFFADNDALVLFGWIVAAAGTLVLLFGIYISGKRQKNIGS